NPTEKVRSGRTLRDQQVRKPHGDRTPPRVDRRETRCNNHPPHGGFLPDHGRGPRGDGPHRPLPTSSVLSTVSSAVVDPCRLSSLWLPTCLPEHSHTHPNAGEIDG